MSDTPTRRGLRLGPHELRLLRAMRQPNKRWTQRQLAVATGRKSATQIHGALARLEAREFVERIDAVQIVRRGVRFYFRLTEAGWDVLDDESKGKEQAS
jgi:DNA-binding PadR family transcriptional regulator